ncbi:MAG: hypothetical protein IPO17_13400 [Flavobacteriales bacterium]|nr:hypothetical protein [Flavobacteriales bacterium]
MALIGTRFKRSLLAIGLLYAGLAARAGHFAGGDITYECLGGNSYEITLDLFLDCSGAPMIPQDLDFSSDCGISFTVLAMPVPAPVEVSQLCAAELPNSSCSGGAWPGMEHYVFTTIVNLPPCNDWNISWDLCCRAGTLNLTGTPGMYIYANLDNATAPCNNSPVFTDQSIPYVCVNQPVNYNYGVTEPDGNTIVYSLNTAYFAAGSPVPYQGGYTGLLPAPGITIDPATGQLSFTPALIGNYVVTVLVQEFDVNGVLIGSVMRDQMFVVLACTGNVPVTNGISGVTGGAGTYLVTGSNSIEVCDGANVCVDVVFSDADPATVLQVVSLATVLLPGATFTVTGTNPATATICWTADAAFSPVNVLITADDGNCPVENVASTSINFVVTQGGGAAPDPGTNGSVTVCGTAAPIDLFTELGGTPDVGGSWTAPGGGAHTGMYDPVVDGPGIYTYSVGNACASATATVTVTETAGPNAGANGTLNTCANNPASSLFAALGGTPQAGGTWTAPGGAAHGANYDPAVDAPGIYTYTVAGVAPCGNATATVTVTEVAGPNAGTNGTLTVCANGAATPLFAQLGGAPPNTGTWTNPLGVAHGVGFNPNYNPVTHNPGVYTYTVPGVAPCAAATSTVTVTEVPLPDAGTNGTLSLCANALPADMFASLGGTPQAGGWWTAPGGAVHGANYDPAVDAPGIYVYHVAAPPCASATATITVTETAAPNAGTNGTLTLCSNGASTNMFASLVGGPQAGGTWTAPGGAAHAAAYNPAVDVPGIYTYTVGVGGPCGSSSSTVTVTENPATNAGTNGVLTICSNGAAVALFASLGGTPQAGGAWSAPGGAAHGVNYDPTVDAPGIYTYTVTGIAPCANATATVTVTENSATNAGTNGTLTICSNGAAVALFASLGGAPQAGGAWTAPGGAAHGVNYDPVVDAPGIYTYTVTGVAPCTDATATVTVTENPATNAGTNGTLTICSNGGAVALFASLGGTPQAGGAWTAPGGAAHGINYDPTVDLPGIYTYTVAGVAPCANATASVTVTENTTTNAGNNGALTICSNGAAVGLFASLGGTPQAGGAWTAPGGAAHGVNYDPVVDAPGIYTYTVTGVAPCANATATVTVTENPATNAGTNGTQTICSNGAAFALFASLGGTPQAGGAWTAPGGAAHGVNYDPVVDAPGIYTYTVVGVAPCANATATVTVTENPATNAGTNGTLTICSNGAAVALLASLGGAPQAGGAWTAPGGAAHGVNYDPTVDAPGIYTYTVTGVAPCADATATVTVTENPATNAGTNGTLTLCSNGVGTDMFLSLGGAPQAGGTWTAPGGVAHGASYVPAMDTPGIYTYTVAGIAPCANATATVTVTEDPAPNAGTNGNWSLCSSGGPVSLFAALGGPPQAGGIWTAPGGLAHGVNYDPAVDVPGVYTYTIVGIAPCANATSTVTVTESIASDAGTNGVLTLCSSDAAVNLFGLLGGAPQAGGNWTAPGGAAHGANYDPAIDGPGVYTYTIPAAPPCPAVSSTVTVTENLAPNAGLNGALAICANDPITDLLLSLGGLPQIGGTWTAPGGGAHSGNYDPTTDAPGVYTYTIVGIAPCTNASATVSVTENAAPNAGSNGALTICDNSVALDMFLSLGGAPQGGGTWTAPGGAAHGANYDPSIDAPGIYTYTVAGVAPCGNATATVTVTENAAANAGTNGTLTICANSPAADMFLSLGGSPQAGGIWTAPGGAAHGANYDPAVDAPGIYTYTVVGIAPCLNATATVTVTENAPPDAGINGALTVCSNSLAANMFLSLGGSPDIGGGWTAPGGVAHGTNYDPAVDAPGIYTYTVNGIAPCANATATVTVTENTAPSAGSNSSVVLCDQAAPSNLFNALAGAPTAGGTWTAPGGAGHSGTVDPAVDPAGVYTYVVLGIAPCPNASATVTVTITSTPDAGINGTLTLCSQSAPTALFASLGGSPDAGGNWSAPGGAAHSGVFDPATDPAGVYTYAIAAVAPCPGAIATVTVSINAAPDAGANGNLSVCAQGAAVAMFTSLGGSPDAGGSWTALGGAAHGANYDPAIDAPGIYTYTVAGVAPCANATATVTVAEVAVANAGTNGAITICSNSGVSNMFLALGGAPQVGGTWTAPGGAAHSANYDPAIDGPGFYTYTVTGTTPCPNATATVTVTENVAPSAGSDAAMIVCDQSAPQSLIAFLGGFPQAGGTWTAPGGGAHSGIIDPSIDPPGGYTYTVAGVAPCANASATVTVTITGSPDAGTNGALTLCATGAPTSLFAALGGSPDAGGSWTDPNGLAHGPNVDPSVDPSGVYTYTIAAIAPCLGATSTVTVTINALPDPGTNGALTVCDQGAPQGLFAALGGSPAAGGTWTAPGGAAHSGTIDPTVDPAGVYTYTVPGAAPCASASATVTVTITSSPDAGTNGAWTLCEDMAPTSLFAALGGSPDAGGTWTAGLARKCPVRWSYTIARHRLPMDSADTGRTASRSIRVPGVVRSRKPWWTWTAPGGTRPPLPARYLHGERRGACGSASATSPLQVAECRHERLAGRWTPPPPPPPPPGLAWGP